MSNLTINAAPDGVNAAAPAGFNQAVNSAIQYVDNTFIPQHGNVYVNIDFRYAPITGGVAESNTFYTSVNYGRVRDALRGTDRGIPADAGFTVPNGDPFGFFGFGDLHLTHSQEATLGLPSPDYNPFNTTLDATITLNSNRAFGWSHATTHPGQYDAVGTLEHEMSEVFGRACGMNPGGFYPTPFALFRYNGGAIDTTDGYIGDYFSLNGGTPIHTLMGQPNGDLGDWNSTTADCCGGAWLGHPQFFSSADVRAMEAIGWKA